MRENPFPHVPSFRRSFIDHLVSWQSWHFHISMMRAGIIRLAMNHVPAHSTFYCHALTRSAQSFHLSRAGLLASQMLRYLTRVQSRHESRRSIKQNRNIHPVATYILSQAALLLSTLTLQLAARGKLLPCTCGEDPSCMVSGARGCCRGC